MKARLVILTTTTSCLQRRLCLRKFFTMKTLLEAGPHGRTPAPPRRQCIVS